jgi:hypothetical protein
MQLDFLLLEQRCHSPQFSGLSPRVKYPSIYGPPLPAHRPVWYPGRAIIRLLVLNSSRWKAIGSEGSNTGWPHGRRLSQKSG